MITNTGKQILAKYLMGTTQSYAAYIAAGCGVKPRPTTNTISGASSSTGTVTVSSTQNVWVGAVVTKVSGTGTLSAIENTVVTSIVSGTTFTISPVPTVALSSAVISLETNPDIDVLGLEMFRVPITSRGYIDDNGTNKIVLTAELPTEERYEISEVGIFSAGGNTSAGSYDSKTLTAFADTENWQFISGGSPYSSSTGSAVFDYVVDELANTSTNIITSTAPAIQTNSTNFTFLDSTRSARYEGGRYLNNLLLLKGDSSTLTKSAGKFVIGSTPKYFQLTGQKVDLSRNSTSDLLKIAFSLVSIDGNSASVPDTVRVLVEFSDSTGSQYARLEAEVTGASLTYNRYAVVEKRLDELIYNTTGAVFSWNSVDTVKVYASVITSSVVDNDYYVALDALRFDNVSTLNPLYGLTGYSIVKSTDTPPSTILKSANTNNYLEFRFILDVT